MGQIDSLGKVLFRVLIHFRIKSITSAFKILSDFIMFVCFSGSADICVVGAENGRNDLQLG